MRVTAISPRAFRDRRRTAYRAIFASLDKPHWRIRVLAWIAALILPNEAAYAEAFRSVHTRIVLADLRRFCRATRPTFVPGDTHASAFSEGRREVWLRINSYLYLDEVDIYGLEEDQVA